MFSLFPAVAHLMDDPDLPDRGGRQLDAVTQRSMLRRARQAVGHRLIALGSLLAMERHAVDRGLGTHSLTG